MFTVNKKRIYLDYASGTACDQDVFNAMVPYFTDQAFNPGGMYRESVQVQNIIMESRIVVAGIIKSQASEIYFVDGATEANNIAIIGVVNEWKKNNPDKIPHIITTEIEHAAVLETCKYLESNGVEVSYLSVDTVGEISIKELKESLQENTVLISIGYVNGEIGTIQDIRAVMKTIRHYRKHNNSYYPYVHTDAVQATNYVENLGVPQLGVDLMTINGSKIYGPKKIAALYIKKNTPIQPIIFGGNQEQGIRSGTENVPYIVGFTEALQKTRIMQSDESSRLKKLQHFLESEIKNYDENIILNSSSENKNPNIINITVPDLSHEEIVIRLDAAGFMCSVKSACKAGEDGDSHVIRAIAKGNRPDRSTGSLRISLGREITKGHLEKFMKSFIKIVDGMKETYKNLIK